MRGQIYLKYKSYPIIFFIFTLCGLDVHAQIPKHYLVAWFKANEGVKSVNDSVFSWTDISSNHADAFVASPVKPILIRKQINGYPAVRFNGQDNGLQTANPVSSFENLRGSIFVVLKVNGRSYTSSVGSGNVVSTYAGKGMCWQLNVTPKKFSFYDGISAEELDISPLLPTEWSIVSLIRNNDSTIDFFHNGLFQSSVPVSKIPSEINTLKIGYNGSKHFRKDNVSEVFNGDIAEIIIYNDALSQKDLAAMHHYLSSKYNIELLQEPYYRQYWFYGFIIIILILFILLISNYFQKRSIKKQLSILTIQQALEQERKRIANDMHDEIGSGISRIALLSQIIKQESKSDGNDLNLEKLKSISQQLSGQLNEMIWSINPEQDRLDSLLGYIRYYVVELLEENNKELIITFPEELPNIAISPDFRRNLFFITKEAVNNALKYSSSKKMELSFTIYDQNKFIYSIRDFGVGFNPEKIREFSNGIASMKLRGKSIDCRLEINSKDQEGTIITLTGVLIYYKSSIQAKGNLF